MLLQIFLFEIRYRLKRPGVYLCFLAAFLFPFLSFSLGHVPVADKEFINAPALLAFFSAITSMLMMLISSAIMGVPLYRDIEHGTREYYLSYPITKAGYFWGRFCGSFLFVLIIAAAIPLGAWLGCLTGRATGWTEASRYGPNRLLYYLHPYLTIAVPNLIFTSSLFFGLVAATRNVKVIYSSGIILFLGYMISNFFLHGTQNATVINLADPFGITPIRLETSGYTATRQNTALVSIHGSFLVNRLLWPGIGLLVLLVIYARFSFERFFSGRADKKTALTGKDLKPEGASAIPAVPTRFSGSYHRQTLYTLTRIELLNIIRDNYFWIILSCGSIFLGFVFWNNRDHYWVPDLPRTVSLLFLFNDNFLFFIFIILIFYTGETIQREKTTRYATINDALPPPNWVLSTSKLFSLLSLAAMLAILPIVLGMGIQLAKGFTQFNFPIYFTYLAVDLPLFTEMVLFSYMLHVVVNNKFAANGIGIAVWVALFLLLDSGKMDYRLFLYSYTPWYRWSDMDGIGHMALPVFWYHLYWLLGGGLFLVLAALFYNRGVLASFSERRQLARERFGRNTRIAAFVLLAGFIAAGSYIYYNTSYLNDYLTHTEVTERKVIFEKQLKHYESLPLPRVTKIRMIADLFPEDRKAIVKAYITLVNKTSGPIDSLLLDADNLSEYSLKYNGNILPYTSPLVYPRGKFNVLRPPQDTAEYRLYRLPRQLAPGDTALVEINSVVAHEGFANNLDAPAFLHNGMFFNGGLPGMGYDAGDELGRQDDRDKYHLPKKKYEVIPHGDPKGINNLSEEAASDLFSLDIIVSTSADQTVLAPGALRKEWKENGRNYYHYVQDQPGMYFHFGVLSARYAVLRDSVRLDGGRNIPIYIYYHPEHAANLARFLAACKDGLRYYSRAYGPYPFERVSLAETSQYGPNTLQLPGMITYSENFGWNAGFTDPNQLDYCYFITGDQLAGEWWGQQVAPNNTTGSKIISEGLARYSSLVLAEKKYGKDNMMRFLGQELGEYNWGRFRMQRVHESGAENTLLNADQSYIWQNKGAIVLYGLKDLVGEDSLNAALREFNREYAFRAHPPFAGSDDLYRALQKHIPDSFRYYLTDTWERVCFYENKVLEASATPLGKSNDYKVSFKISMRKLYVDPAGEEHPAAQMNDYIDIAIFAETHPIYFKKYRLTAGEHTIGVIVHGKPVSVGIDPYLKLLDRNPGDNKKGF